MRALFMIAPLALLGSTAVFAQPSIQFGPGGVRVDPGGPREERIVRYQGGCKITIIRRGGQTVRRIRECDDDDDE